MKRAEYGNWVPSIVFKIMIPASILLLLIFFAFVFLFDNIILSTVMFFIFALFILFTSYMWLCQRYFSFEHGGLMGDIHEYLLNNMDWDGRGILIDIGCGSGALTIRCAKRYPYAEILGVDFWSKDWDYCKSQCEENAFIEGVEKRTIFEKGDAANLSYNDEYFDAAISNFVFHEVRSVRDKREVVREALRVIKKGGSFAFQDMFGSKKLYGNIHEFIETLKDEGISEIHYIPDIEKSDFIPNFTRTPWMLCNMGIIYGKK